MARFLSTFSNRLQDEDEAESDDDSLSRKDKDPVPDSANTPSPGVKRTASMDLADR